MIDGRYATLSETTEDAQAVEHATIARRERHHEAQGVLMVVMLRQAISKVTNRKRPGHTASFPKLTKDGTAARGRRAPVAEKQ